MPEALEDRHGYQLDVGDRVILVGRITELTCDAALNAKVRLEGSWGRARQISIPSGFLELNSPEGAPGGTVPIDDDLIEWKGGPGARTLWIRTTTEALEEAGGPLAELLDLVGRGTDIVLVRDGEPAAKLVGSSSSAHERK